MLTNSLRRATSSPWAAANRTLSGMKRPCRERVAESCGRFVCRGLYRRADAAQSSFFLWCITNPGRELISLAYRSRLQKPAGAALSSFLF